MFHAVCSRPAQKQTSPIPTQGPLLKRHRVPYNNGTLSPSDFHIGTPLVLYNTTYHMVDADTFTRTFYENAGAPLPGPLPVPSQPLEEHHAKLQQRAQVAHSVVIPGEMSMTQYCEAMLGKPVVDRKLKQFIENNKQVWWWCWGCIGMYVCSGGIAVNSNCIGIAVHGCVHTYYNTTGSHTHPCLHTSQI